jgi:hypothetical protein
MPPDRNARRLPLPRPYPAPTASASIDSTAYSHTANNSKILYSQCKNAANDDITNITNSHQSIFNDLDLID